MLLHLGTSGHLRAELGEVVRRQGVVLSRSVQSLPLTFESVALIFMSTIYRPFRAARSPAANHLSSLTAMKVECGDPARIRKEADRSCRVWSAMLAENP